MSGGEIVMDDMWQKALVALERGDFTRLGSMLGGPAQFDEQITEWHKKGMFNNEPAALEDVFACACFLGRTSLAKYLLDNSVDPMSVRSGQSGFHYAAMAGHLDTINLLIARKIPLEIENMYGGTVLGQALWSVVNEHMDSHAAVIEALIDAGAVFEPGTLEWWEAQNIPSAETKKRVAAALQQRSEIDDILKHAHAMRHVGIEYEKAGRLEEAEKHYDETLALYRQHSLNDDLDYANAVRYDAVIKERLGKDEESIGLWSEAYDRYEGVGIVEGVAEAAAWLTLLYHRKGEAEKTQEWFANARAASRESSNHATHKFIAEVKTKIES